MAQHWLGANGRQARQSIDAFIGIGMGAIDVGQRMVEPFVLDRLVVPTLDLFGGPDYPAVRRLAPVRLVAMRRAGHPKSAQVVVPGANHYFTDRAEALLRSVIMWLNAL
jgi:hypothetical protein